ncbi:ATP-binding protein [Metallosphaera tengchongensis]|uniref:ATP-binding protein n=1 Tax=Metallosphaera tengchongensis TaxID=1532350 RepID=A0A6N0NXN8_9CREN|nr:ATP-binding protein [Metallosphaera tengchongensis]QKQ99879.1 ATP-binding protein [Metallosphaera tengchongensis]
MNSRLPPLILISVGVALLLFQIYHLPLVLLVLPILLSIVAVLSQYFLGRNNIISDTVNKHQIFEIKSNNRTFTGAVLKISGRIEVDKNNVGFQKELENLMETIGRRDVGFEYYVITNLSKKKASSALVIIKECSSCEDDILNEVRDLQDISKAVSPHLHLEISPTSEKSIPVPTSWGNLGYAKVYHKIIDSPTNLSLSNDYDIELGEMKTDLTYVKTGIKLADLTRHIGIFGSTGSGKSTTASILIKRLYERGYKSIVLDWHGEYIDKLKFLNIRNQDNIFKINPLRLGNIEDIVEILGDVLNLTDPQKFLLYTVLIRIRKVGKFDLKTLIRILRSVDETSNWMREVKYGLLRKIYLLFVGDAKKIFDNQIEKMDPNELLNSVIDLSFISNLRLRRIYSMFIIKIISDYYIRNKPSQNALLVIEEAHNYFHKDNEFLEKLITEVRKFGLGLCIISQSPSSITPEVLKNTNTKIIHSIKSDFDKKILAESLSLDLSLYNAMDKLEIGEAIISAPNIKIPVIIKIKM